MSMLLLTVLSLVLTHQPQSAGPAQPIPAARAPDSHRALVSVPVGVLADSRGGTVLTDIIEVTLDRPLVDQLPRTAPVIVAQGDTVRAHTHEDEQAGILAPTEVEVGYGGQAWIPRHAGVCTGTARAGAAELATFAHARGTTAPINYTQPDELRPLAYGPRTLVRKADAGYLAVVPGKVVIDEHGTFHITLKDVGPFAKEPTPAELPQTVPVFSLLAGVERPGAFRRNYSNAADHFLDDRRATEFLFCPGLGYQFVQTGPTGNCGTGLQSVKPRYQPGASEHECMPGSQTAAIRYTPYTRIIHSLTPTISWKDNVRRHHIFIREGAMVYDELDAFARRDIEADRFALPAGALRAGMTYHLLVTAETSGGYAIRSIVFTTAADSAPDKGDEVLDISNEGKSGQ